MARPARIDFPGARHHVVSRGARREPIFFDDDCCALFLEVLSSLPARYGIEIHGYALMPNHFHLLVRSERGQLSLGMSYLLSRYVRAINRTHAWDGPLLKGRFHHRLVKQESHWVHLLAYLHLNPLRAGLVTRLSQSRWTSHGAYAGVEARPEWLSVEDHLQAMGSVAGYWQYLRGVRIGRIEAPTDFAQVCHVGGKVAPQEKPKPASRAVASPVLSGKEALRHVAQAMGCSIAALKETRRGRSGNLPRVVAAYWLVYGAGLTNVEAGRVLRMHPVRVSQSVSRVRARKSDDAVLGETITALERKKLNG